MTTSIAFLLLPMGNLALPSRNLAIAGFDPAVLEVRIPLTDLAVAFLLVLTSSFALPVASSAVATVSSYQTGVSNRSCQSKRAQERDDKGLGKIHSWKYWK